MKRRDFLLALCLLVFEAGWATYGLMSGATGVGVWLAFAGVGYVFHVLVRGYDIDNSIILEQHQLVCLQAQAIENIQRKIDEHNARVQQRITNQEN